MLPPRLLHLVRWSFLCLTLAPTFAAASASIPCCTAPSPEGDRVTKCMRRARGENGGCKPIHRKFCPVACGHCTICASHPLYSTYQKLYYPVSSSVNQGRGSPFSKMSSATQSGGNQSSMLVRDFYARPKPNAMMTDVNQTNVIENCTDDLSAANGGFFRGMRQGVEEVRSRYRCLPGTGSPGKRPLCARKGFPWVLAWSRRLLLMLRIEREGETFAQAIEAAHAKAHADVNSTLEASHRPAWMAIEAAERQELAAAQSELASLLKATRSRRAEPCAQLMPWFYVSNKNFGDELNVDIGVVMLGDQSAYRKLFPMRRMKGDHMTITAEPRPLGYETRLWTTVDANVSHKILAIGSTIGDVRTGDIVMGVGAKAFRQQIGFAAHASLLPAAVEALKDANTTIAAVRGPQTCRTLHRYGITKVGCADNGGQAAVRAAAAAAKSSAALPPLPYGDPALVAHLLLPWWRDWWW